MSVFSHSDSPSIDRTGVGADGFTRNLTVASIAFTAGTIGAAAILQPTFVAPAVGLAGAGVLYAASKDKCNDHIPFLPSNAIK